MYLGKMVCARHKYCGGTLGCRIKCYIRAAFGCNFELCTLLYTVVHHCALFAHYCTLLIVHYCTPLYTTVHPCTLLYTLVHYCIPLYTIVHPCTLLSTLVHYCPPLYTIVHSDTLLNRTFSLHYHYSASLKRVKSLKQYSYFLSWWR